MLGPKLGDSGSWVVDDHSGQLFGVIVARASGLGFAVPFEHIRKSIATSMDLHPSDVRLPRPNQAETTGSKAVVKRKIRKWPQSPELQFRAIPQETTNQPPGRDSVGKRQRLGVLILSINLIASVLVMLTPFLREFRLVDSVMLEPVLGLPLRAAISFNIFAALFTCYPHSLHSAIAALAAATGANFLMKWLLEFDNRVEQLNPQCKSATTETNSVVH